MAKGPKKVRCPRCLYKELEIKQRVSEHAYIIDVDAESQVIGYNVVESSDIEFIHIHCAHCDTYWYSEGEFFTEYTKWWEEACMGLSPDEIRMMEEGLEKKDAEEA